MKYNNFLVLSYVSYVAALLLCYTFKKKYFTFTFSHLADAFIQRDLQLGST